jgi:hypothetical protein
MKAYKVNTQNSEQYFTSLKKAKTYCETFNSNSYDLTYLKNKGGYEVRDNLIDYIYIDDIQVRDNLIDYIYIADIQVINIQ